MSERRARYGLTANTFGAVCLAMVLWSAGPPESPVADAAERGDIETVRTLLREGADVNAAQGDGMTALHWAALNDDAAMIEVLAYAGANVAATTRLGGYTPLHLASQKGFAKTVQSLLEAGSKASTPTTTGVTAIHLAAEAGQPEAIRALLEHGANANARESFSNRTPLMFATARNRLEAMKTLIAAGADVSLATEVVDFAERSNVDDVERRRRDRILAAAQPPRPPENARNAERQPPDSTAAPEGRQQQAQGERRAAQPAEPRADRPPAADPDSPTRPDTAAAQGQAGQGNRGGNADSTADRSRERPLSYDDLVGKQGGMTALHYAARDGRGEAVRLLLESGGAINARTLGDQSTPLLIAIINGNFDLAMMLLEMGADPNLASEDGAAPLFATLNNEWALRTWYPQPTASGQQQTTYLDLMKALLDAGADPNARVNTHIWYAAYNAGRMGVDYSGATAFWRAAYATDVAAMRLLVAYGADPNIPTTKPASGRRRGIPGSGNSDDSTGTNEDPSGLPPVETGGPAVHPLHAASGVGYGTSRVGQQHRHVPDGWLPAVRYLIDELGVDVNVRDHDGYSAVHNAAARGDNEMIQYLVDHGADVTFVSRRGQTTVDMANGPQQRVQPFPETIALLESLGAKNNNNCMSC